MPESLLTVLKFCFLALLYLFFLRVVRAVWAEVSGPPAGQVAAPARAAAPAAKAAAAPAAAPAPSRARGRRGGEGRRLVVVEPPDRASTAYDVGDELTVGRAASCQVVLDDTFASQLHARLFRKDGKIFLEDVGSTNGTYVNRKKVGGPVALRPGDRVQIGKTVLELD